jgi:acyl carrier protein
LAALELIAKTDLSQICVTKTSTARGKKINASAVNDEKSDFSSKPVTPAIPLRLKKLYPRPSLDTPYIAAVTETEILLAEIWSAMLAIEEIGVNDDFFSLGGHSLMAVRLTFRIREKFEIEFALSDLLNAPTVAKTADLIIEKKFMNFDAAELQRLLSDFVRS